MGDYSQFVLDRTSEFAFTELKIQATFTEPTDLPAFKGSTFHGGFGWALEAVSQQLQTMLYRPTDEKGHTQPKPFIIVPPDTNQQRFREGETFTFTVKLLSTACELLDDICAALFLWQELGLGPSRSKFAIQAIDMILPNEDLRIFQRGQPRYLMPQPLMLAPYLENTATTCNLLSSSQIEVMVNFTTPVQLIKQGVRYTSAPPLDILQWFILHRAAGLMAAWSPAGVKDFNHYSPEASNLTPQCLSQHIFHVDRYSKTQEQRHPLPGFTGCWVYQIHEPNTLLLLKLAEQLHIGKKSSFGFGRITYNVAIKDKE